MMDKKLNGHDRVIAQIKGDAVDCLPFMPITMLFVAARYGVKFYDYITDQRTMVESQLRMAEEFDSDLVTINSDPAREATDLGAEVRFFEDQPAAIVEDNALLKDKIRLAKLEVPDPMAGERMRDRIKAAELCRKHVEGEKIIQGWVEGPLAMSSDLRGINTIMIDLVDDPAFVRDLFAFCVEMELRFAKAQIDAGVNLMGIGDAAASLAGPKLYRELVWPYEKKLVDGIHEMGVFVDLHICGRTRDNFEPMGELKCDIVDLDYPAPLDEARAQMGPDQVLLGNIDPVRVLKDSSPDDVYQAIEECHRQAGPRYIVSAGCEVPPETPAENVHAMREYARSHK